MTRRLTAIIERERTGYVALCPEVDVASQGASVAEARANLVEALALFFDHASPEEVELRAKREVREDRSLAKALSEPGLTNIDFEPPSVQIEPRVPDLSK